MTREVPELSLVKLCEESTWPIFELDSISSGQTCYAQFMFGFLLHNACSCSKASTCINVRMGLLGRTRWTSVLNKDIEPSRKQLGSDIQLLGRCYLNIRRRQKGFEECGSRGSEWVHKISTQCLCDVNHTRQCGISVGPSLIELQQQ